MEKKLKLITLGIFCLCCSRFQGYGQYKTNVNPGIENISFQWPEGKRIAISLTFDDARLSQVDKGIPLLDQYGIQATFYMSYDNMMKRLEKWNEALKKGHEIGNHSLLHPCSGNFTWSRDHALEDYTQERMSAELDSANKVILNYLGVKPVSYAYPCGQSFVGRGKQTRSYVPVVATQFETGRIWPSEEANDPAYCDMAQVASTDLDGKTFEEIRKLIEKSAGRWLILTGHEMDEEGTQCSRLITIEAICRYAADPENGIWIANVRDIARYIRKNRDNGTF